HNRFSEGIEHQRRQYGLLGLIKFLGREFQLHHPNCIFRCGIVDFAQGDRMHLLPGIARKCAVMTSVYGVRFHLAPLRVADSTNEISPCLFRKMLHLFNPHNVWLTTTSAAVQRCLVLLIKGACEREKYRGVTIFQLILTPFLSIRKEPSNMGAGTFDVNRSLPVAMLMPWANRVVDGNERRP